MVGVEEFVSIGEIDILEMFGIREFVEGQIRKKKIELVKQLFKYDYWAELFTIIQNATASKSVTISPTGILDVLIKYLEKTCDLSSYVGEEIGSESIMEMLSEGLSSALETNFNGALQYILNVWKGSLPPDLSFALSIGQRLDRVSRLYALSQIAPIGHNPQAILESLISGADARLREKLSTVKQTYLEYLTAKNSGLTEYITQFTNFIADAINELIFGAITMIDKIDGLINAVAQEHLARLNQLDDNLEANKLRYDYDIIDDETYQQRLTEIDIDVDATSQVYNEWINAIDGEIDEYVNWLNTYANDIVLTITSLLDAYEEIVNSVINKIVNVIQNTTDDTNLKNMVLELYEDLKAYRKAGFDYA